MAIDTLGANALASDSVTTVKIANDAVTAAKIPAGAVVADIADGGITTAKLADDAVTSAKVADDAVTGGKLANDISISTTGNIVTTGSGTITSAGLITASGSVAIGGTGSANTLDDYEEGTFTPVLAYATGGTTGIAYNNQIGRYTKIGRVVSIYYRIALSNKGSGTGNAYISGLPFTVANVTQYPAAYGLHHDVNSGFGNSVANILPVSQLFNNTTTIYWYNPDSTTAITHDYFNNNTTINGNVVYETA